MKIDFGEPIEFDIPIADFPLKDLQFKSLSKQAHISVFVLKSAYDEMIEHVNVDKTIECGGILVGYPFQDPDAEEVFVVIVGIIRDVSDDRSVVHFTVTPEVIAKTREILEEKYPELIAVGWYHSHPGHGVFLSGQDMTIVRGIYNEEWNLAWVIDPIREQEGIFYGANGEPIVKNKSSNPLNSKSRQTWFPLDKPPRCIKDLQQGKLKITKRIETNVKPRVEFHEPPKGQRETNQTKSSKKLTPLILIGLGATALITIAFLAIFYYGPTVNPAATPILPIILTSIPPSSIPPSFIPPSFIPPSCIPPSCIPPSCIPPSSIPTAAIEWTFTPSPDELILPPTSYP